MNYKLLICFVLLSLTTVSAQSTIDKALIEIAKNNKTIQANTQYWNAQKITFIWVTDGAGWKSTLKPLREYFDKADYLLNLEMLKTNVLKSIL